VHEDAEEKVEAATGRIRARPLQWCPHDLYDKHAYGDRRINSQRETDDIDALTLRGGGGVKPRSGMTCWADPVDTSLHMYRRLFTTEEDDIEAAMNEQERKESWAPLIQEREVEVVLE
jgi:hypothetical protein